tara:strand:+ start:1193 stop:3004 length:1812 start_codon:yes stop_codon:yes gene_type:complete
MAKYDDKNKKVPIKYTSRSFNNIKEDLVNYVKRYYPDTYKDFNDASFGSLVMDTVAYTGDILSFYLDYQANESFLDTANEYNNVVKLTRQMGYKYRGRASTHGYVSFFILVPADTTGLGPDTRYVPVLKRRTEVASTAGENFILTDDVDFRNASNEIVVGKVNTQTGLPTHYIIKATGRVISGRLVQKNITFGSFKKFNKVLLGDSNVAEILECTDKEGHEYYEVEHLAQDVIYREIPNSDSATRDAAPMLLKPTAVPRRFVLERNRGETFMHFGYGSEEDIKIDKVVDPANIVLNQFGRDYVTNTDFDPSNLLGSDKFGVSPVNTILRVIFRVNSSANPNASVGSVSQIIRSLYSFEDQTALDQGKLNSVRSSLECTNDTPIVGHANIPTTEELKVRTKSFFATQNRAVTREDYKSLVYNMPPRYGAVKRCAVLQDKDSFKRNLNMYVISENKKGNLTNSNDIIKSNIKTWLNEYRMVNDTLDIMDAKIINLSLSFTIVTKGGYDKFRVLDECLRTLRNRYLRHFDIAEPFSFTEVYSTLNRIEGVADTTDVTVLNQNGGAYSQAALDITANITPDGRFIACPLNGIFEVKFPTIDIKGSVK